jgi:hypothetical protein
MRTTIYAAVQISYNSLSSLIQETVAAWLNYLPGSISNGKRVKEVVYF